MWQSNIRAHRVQSGLKPQDILVLLKLLASQNRDWRLVDLGMELGISQSEISMSLERARRSGFVDESKKKLIKSSLEEFLIHGLKYVYPAELGPLSRGIPTAHSARPLSERIVSNENDQFVWSHSEGGVRGQSVSPLCEWAPEAARRDPILHELLSLVDAIRVGRAREKMIAADELHKRLQYAP